MLAVFLLTWYYNKNLLPLICPLTPVQTASLLYFKDPFERYAKKLGPFTFGDFCTFCDIFTLAIRDGAFGACSLRGLPAAGSLRSPLPLALASHLHTLSSTIKISKIVLFRFLASGGLGGHHRHHRHRLNSPRYGEKLSCADFSKKWPQMASIRPDMMNKCQMQLFQKTASNGLNSPQHDEKVSSATFSKNGLEWPRTTSNYLGGRIDQHEDLSER